MVTTLDMARLRMLEVMTDKEACPEQQDEIHNTPRHRPHCSSFNEACPEGWDEIANVNLGSLGYLIVQPSLPRRAG